MAPASTRELRPDAAVRGLFLAFGFVIAAFFPFLALYLDGKGLGGSEIGLVIAIMAVARILLNPLWGHLADATLGRRTCLQIGSFVSGCFGLVLGAADGVVAIAVAGFLLAAAMVSTGPNIDAITLEHLGAERMSDYGKIRSWESLTYAIGCLTLGWVFEVGGVGWAMPAYTGASLLVFAWSFTVPRDTPRHEAATKGSRLGTVGAVFHEAPRFWRFLVAVFLVWTGFNAAWNFIALKIASEGGGPLLVGIGTAAGGLVEVAMMRSSSRLQARFGARRVYALGCAVYALGFMLWGSISNPTIVSLLTVLEGMAFSMLFTTSVVVVGRLLPSTLYSTGNSVAQMVGFGLGPIIGAGVGGYVYETAGPMTLYAGASALALAGGVVAWFALRGPELDAPVTPDDDMPADAALAPPEPLG
ncbi:MAG TPA: MFS transporter [Actinomycetota bacterium]|nr:MFS transporter [Actinomycetota bacterium]